jgi:hypothetical protein
MPEVTPISKKSDTKYFNWHRYFLDMYVSAVRAGTGAFLAFAGTNTAEALPLDVLQNIGMNGKQAIAAGVASMLFDMVRYINLKPLPPEETAETSP